MSYMECAGCPSTAQIRQACLIGDLTGVPVQFPGTGKVRGLGEDVHGGSHQKQALHINNCMSNAFSLTLKSILVFRF